MAQAASNPRIPFQLSSERVKLDPPEGKPLIVHVVVNVEHWEFDQPMPRTAITPPQGKAIVPDVPNWSWAEYGNRCGMPRLLKALAERGLPASASINAACFEVYPSLGKAILDAGWEIVGHGIHQHSVFSEPDERAYLERALGLFETHAGKRPRGWLGPGLAETHESADILKELGVDHVYDWMVDDIPTWIDTRHGPLMAMPYTLDLNDSVITAVEKHASDEMYRRVQETVAVFEREFDENPRMLTLATHPHLTGVPHRMGYFARILDMLMAREDAIFMTGSRIADWFVAAEKKARG